jgi:hypothetical protein
VLGFLFGVLDVKLNSALNGDKSRGVMGQKPGVWD